MKKTIQKSVRISQEVYDLVMEQIGEGFADKFQRMVYNCYMLEHEKTAELSRLDEQIQSQQERLENIRRRIDSINKITQTLDFNLTVIEMEINAENKG